VTGLVKKILLFTGKQAYPLLVDILANTRNSVVKNYDMRVEKIDVSVAAFITPRKVLDKELVIKEFEPDIILVPGLCKKDFKVVEDKIRIKTRKGTENIGQLPDLLEQLESLVHVLSTEKAADKFLGLKYRKKTEKILKERIANLDLFTTSRNFVTASGMKIGLEFPVRVFSEIVDATLKPLSRILDEARYIKRQGADVIDFGCAVDNKRPTMVENGIKAILKETGMPVSVDSMDPTEIIAGAEAGAEFVLSIDQGNQEVISRIHGDPGLVLLPTNVANGYSPKSTEERTDRLLEIETVIREKGFSKILVDPILEAPIIPGFSKSLAAIIDYRKKSPTPMFVGVGNVTEFLETDSSGVNALLSVIAQELGIVGVLTTEEATFTSHSTSELASSVKMVYSATVNQRVPKKLGINSLYCKSNERNRSVLKEPVYLEMISSDVVDYKVCLDPKGCFEIQVDKNRGLILLYHVKEKVIVKTYAAENCLPLLKKIAADDLVSDHFHAAYLGKELMKAEICLKTGRTYIQDRFFTTAADPVEK
jgi:dihydropteroate synthase-like protein